MHYESNMNTSINSHLDKKIVMATKKNYEQQSLWLIMLILELEKAVNCDINNIKNYSDQVSYFNNNNLNILNNE